MTTENKVNALYVGERPEIGDALQSIKPDWNFLPHQRSIEDVWNGLNSGELTNEIQAIFILDFFFDEYGNDTSFEDFITILAPYCFMGILNYQPEQKNRIIERINDAAYKNNTQPPHYFFIAPDNPVETINQGLTKFVNIENPELDYAKSLILGQTIETPSFDIPETEDVYSYETEEVEDPGLDGEIIAITSSKGGSGKSTVAITLSTLLAHSSVNSVREGLEERPLKIILVDLDVRDGQIGFLTNNITPTVLTLRGRGINDETLKETIIHSPRLKIDLLLAPRKPRSSDDTPPDFYLELLQKLKQKYDYVILDTSVNYLDPLLENVAYPMADKIIFVTDIVVNSVFSMTRWVQEVTGAKNKNGMGIDRRKIGIVINKSLSDINMKGEQIQEAALNLPIITAVPSNPKLIAHAANMQTMEALLRHEDLYKSFMRLARAIIRQNYKLSPNVTP